MTYIVITIAVVLVLPVFSIIYWQRKKIQRLKEQQDTHKELTEVYETILSLAGVRFIEQNNPCLWIKKECIGPYVQLKVYDINYSKYSAASAIVAQRGNFHRLEKFVADTEDYGKTIVQELILLNMQIEKTELSKTFPDTCQEKFLECGGRLVVTDIPDKSAS